VIGMLADQNATRVLTINSVKLPLYPIIILNPVFELLSLTLSMIYIHLQ
jgi:hypothetical protein